MINEQVQIIEGKWVNKLRLRLIILRFRSEFKKKKTKNTMERSV